MHILSLFIAMNYIATYNIIKYVCIVELIKQMYIKCKKKFLSHILCYNLNLISKKLFTYYKNYLYL